MLPTLQHVITDKKNQKTELVDAKIVLRSCFFIDVLTPSKIFSLQTRKSDISIIDIVDCVDTTK